jgi:Ca-activated chloride channel homolog
MRFAWPYALCSLLAVPLLLACYAWQLRRRRRNAVRFSSVTMLRDAVGSRSTWRRHLPIAVLLAGFGVLGLATARPQAEVTVPLGRTTIMLALDVSGSMCATDIAPNRLTVAQQAARDFVEGQPAGTRIGIVAFSSSAQTLVAPTTQRDELIQAIDALTTSRGTAIGAAIIQSIDAIAEINPGVSRVDASLPGSGDAAPGGAEPIGAAPGGSGTAGYVPDIIVVLTDGANTRGIAPLDAVPFAVNRRVRVYTIGFGTTNPAGMSCSAEQLGGRALDDGQFGGGNGGGGGSGRRGRFLIIDEPTLQEVASLTGGTYHKAEDAGQLQKVFRDLPQQIELQKQDREITNWFAAAGTFLAFSAIALSLRRHTL